MTNKVKNQEEPKQKLNENVSNKWRQIVIETDGNNIRLVNANVAGQLELIAILQALIGHLSTKKGN